MNNIEPWMKVGKTKKIFNRDIIKIGNPYLINSSNSDWETKWVIVTAIQESDNGDEEIWVIDKDGKTSIFNVENVTFEASSELHGIVGSNVEFTKEEKDLCFNKTWFEERKNRPFMVWLYCEDLDKWVEYIGYVTINTIHDHELMIYDFDIGGPILDTEGYVGLNFKSHCHTIKLINPDHLYIMSTDDMFTTMGPHHQNHSAESLKLLSQNFDIQVTSSQQCSRVIDYKLNYDYIPEGVNNDISYLFEDNPNQWGKHYLRIKQFLYKVTPMLDADNDKVIYSIAYPVSETDKKRYMDDGWKIHPMFYNKENGCYKNSVIINTKKHRYVDTDVCDTMSLTIEIVSGLQLLYLIEFGTRKTDEKCMYHGIEYNNGPILLSNAYTDENNHLFINNRDSDVIVLPHSGYISRFMYHAEYDWLLLPKKMKEKYDLCDSWCIGSTLGMKNSIKWGEYYQYKTGIFRFIMNDSRAISGEEYVMTWQYGE